jgi:putative FmdB family regulatory protein
MPLYEYQCDACGQRFERIQKFSDPPIESCPSCKGAVRKLLSSPAIQFKGSGWYITDYARKSSSDKSAPAGGGDEKKTTDTAAGEKKDKKTDGKETKPSAASE